MWRASFQGVGAALLTPGSMAMIQASFRPLDRARAIGAWAGLGGVFAVVGPFLGGWLVEIASWRWVLIQNPQPGTRPLQPSQSAEPVR